MRIGLIAPPWLPVPPPAYGGTEQVVDALARALDAAGHHVEVFTTGEATCPVRREHVFEEAVRIRLGQSIPELYHVLGAYEALADRDVIHDHTVVGPMVAPLLGRPRVVTTSHGAFTDELRTIYAAMDDRVDVVAISYHQASQAHGVRIARVIHHGLDPDAYPPGDGAGGHLLFLGRMSPDKGVHRAIAVARAAGRRLLIAAKLQEPCEQRYFDEVVEPMLGDDVEYVGEADRDTKRELLAGAAALINPICWPEPFGLVMIEALASGTPVVAFPEGAAPEIVDHGTTGFVCRDEDEMVRAVARIERIDRGTCRTAFEDRFSAARMATEYLDLYEEVLGARPATSVPPRHPPGSIPPRRPPRHSNPGLVTSGTG